MSPLPAMGALPRPKLQAAPQADNKARQQQQHNPRGDSRLAAAADGQAVGGRGGRRQRRRQPQRAVRMTKGADGVFTLAPYDAPEGTATGSRKLSAL
jgi:hypothetical protein